MPSYVKTGSEYRWLSLTTYGVLRQLMMMWSNHLQPTTSYASVRRDFAEAYARLLIQ